MFLNEPCKIIILAVAAKIYKENLTQCGTMCIFVALFFKNEKVFGTNNYLFDDTSGKWFCPETGMVS